MTPTATLAPPAPTKSKSLATNPPAPATAKAKTLPGVALDAYTGDPNFMASLARGLVVIEAFTPQNPQMTISQLSLRTGLSRAAVTIGTFGTEGLRRLAVETT